MGGKSEGLDEKFLRGVLSDLATDLIRAQKDISIAKPKYHLALEQCSPFVGEEKYWKFICRKSLAE